MAASPSRKKSGFTLIELMVVVTIIAVLAALIVPALQKAQAAAMARSCMSRARAIATSLRAYASNWEGWTNRDRDYYVKEFGYRLSTEAGYYGTGGTEAAGVWAADSTSQSFARHGTVGDFRCPVDEDPARNLHAIPSSFRVAKAFAGSNTANLRGQANKILAVKELGARHLIPGPDNAMDRHFVMADLSSTLGFRGDYINGLHVRIWNRTTASGIRDVPEDSLPAPDGEEDVTGFTRNSRWPMAMVTEAVANGVGEGHWSAYGGPTSSNGHWQPRHGNGSARGIYYPGHLIGRIDGLLRFPSAGEYRFATVGCDQFNIYFGIAEEPGTGGSASYQWHTGRSWGPPITANTWSADNWFSAQGGALYRIQCTFEAGGAYGGTNWHYQWHNQTAGGTPSAAEDIPDTALFSEP